MYLARTLQPSNGEILIILSQHHLCVSHEASKKQDCTFRQPRYSPCVAHQKRRNMESSISRLFMQIIYLLHHINAAAYIAYEHQKQA